jgi:hypothetical protein
MLVLAATAAAAVAAGGGCMLLAAQPARSSIASCVCMLDVGEGCSGDTPAAGCYWHTYI